MAASPSTPDSTVELAIADHELGDDNPAPVKIIGASGTGKTAVTIADGDDAALGTTTDTTSANTVIGRLKKLVSLLPTALGGHGALIVEGVASGTPVRNSLTDSAGTNAVAVDSNGRLTANTVLNATAAANVLDGTLSQANVGGATTSTLLTVPAGRTWRGEVAMAVAAQCPAASATTAFVDAVLNTAGTGVTPAAGAIAQLRAIAGINAAAGTVGTSGHNNIRVPVTIIAPAGNSVTLTVTATGGGANKTDSSALGELL